MEKLTIRAIKLNTLITEKGYKTIEVHPTSTRKALNMSTKDRIKIQLILNSTGLGKDLKARTQSSHEIDVIIVALTARLYSQGETESVGDETEGYIMVPKKQDWRTLRI